MQKGPSPMLMFCFRADPFFPFHTRQYFKGHLGAASMEHLIGSTPKELFYLHSYALCKHFIKGTKIIIDILFTNIRIMNRNDNPEYTECTQCATPQCATLSPMCNNFFSNLCFASCPQCATLNKNYTLLR